MNLEVLCNDNLCVVYYVDDGKCLFKRWFIFFESGGFCVFKVDCNRRYKNKNFIVLMILNKFFEIIIGRDLLFILEYENFVFYDYGYIFVFYCSSDFWFGVLIVYNDFFVFMDNFLVNNFIF